MRIARNKNVTTLTAATVLSSLVLAACGKGQAAAPSGAAASSAPTVSPTSGPQPDPQAGKAEKEVASITARLLMAHAGGLTLMEADTGTVLAEKRHPAFLRLTNAGDGRHVMVTDSDTFRVYDTGIQARKHGDHDHYLTATPGLTDTTFAMPHAGHVVRHHGRTLLFADGNGAITTFDSDDVADPQRESTEYSAGSPHHGVAVELTNGTLVTTRGTEEKRHTIEAVRGQKQVARTTDCPGVHGEALARPTKRGEVIAFGCENGPVVYRDGAFHKVPVKDAYSRSGNLFGHPESPIVLGDYKVDEDAEPERPTRVALIDTRTDRLKVTDLGSPYWFRSFARGPEGEGLVLTYDGRLRILDVDSGRQTASVPVISPWKEKKDWQQPGPAVVVAGESAYVTDAEERRVVVVDLATRKVRTSYALPHAPVEIAVTDGRPEAPSPEKN